MTFDFSSFKEALVATEEWLKKELLAIQTGRATPAILDGVMVDSYGSKVPINQVGSVNAEDARTLRIAPWDTDNINAIETAVRDADLGLGIAVDDKRLRVSFPELTTENREKYVKIVKTKLEEARVTLRHERDEVWNAIQKQEKDGAISEDEKFRYKEEMEKLSKDGNTKLEEIASKKEADILN